MFKVVLLRESVFVEVRKWIFQGLEVMIFRDVMPYILLHCYQCSQKKKLLKILG
jgi:hypothetical protein